MEKINLLVLFGGESNEYKVSLLSVSNVLDNIDSARYNIIKVGITQQGEWLLTDANSSEIKQDTWQKNKSNKGVTVNLSREYNGLLASDDKKILVDCALIIMHGKKVEDGCLQGLLEMAHIPYTGCDLLSSAVGMDKLMSKLIIDTIDVKQAKYASTDKVLFEKNAGTEVNRIASFFGNKYPLFVKPANSGSSIGVNKVYNEEELNRAILEALNIDSKILIEETIKGAEIEVALLGNDEPIVSKIAKVISDNEDFYDYESKYISSNTNAVIMSDLDPKIEVYIQEISKKIYKAFNCSGISRIDYFLTENNELVFNEINTMPALGSRSIYIRLLNEMGITASEIIDMLVESAK